MPIMASNEYGPMAPFSKSSLFSRSKDLRPNNIPVLKISSSPYLPL